MNSKHRALGSGQLYWSLVEPVWDKIEIYGGPEEFARSFGAVPESPGLLFAAHFYQSEVCNGGFNQFFSNSTGVLAPEAIKGFNAIGQTLVAEITQKACSLFGEPFPRERFNRQSKLGELESELLNSLDQEFYAVIDSEHGGFEMAADSYAAKVRKSPGS